MAVLLNALQEGTDKRVGFSEKMFPWETLGSLDLYFHLETDRKGQVYCSSRCSLICYKNRLIPCVPNVRCSDGEAQTESRKLRTINLAGSNFHACTHRIQASETCFLEGSSSDLPTFKHVQTYG